MSALFMCVWEGCLNHVCNRIHSTGVSLNWKGKLYSEFTEAKLVTNTGHILIVESTALYSALHSLSEGQCIN